MSARQPAICRVLFIAVTLVVMALTSDARRQHLECDQISVFDAPAPANLLAIRSANAAVLNGAYRREWRYGAGLSPNASSENVGVASTSHDWWWRRFDPKPGVVGHDVYLWRCRGRWQFVMHPPDLDAHEISDEWCAAQASVLLQAYDVPNVTALGTRDRAPTPANACGRPNVTTSLDELAFRNGQLYPDDTAFLLETFRAGTRWLVVHRSRFQALEDRANELGPDAVDIEANTTTGLSFHCHVDVSCPFLSASAGAQLPMSDATPPLGQEDLAFEWKRRHSALFNTMPMFDAFVASHSTPPPGVAADGHAATLVFCPAQGVWALAARRNASRETSATSAASFPFVDRDLVIGARTDDPFAYQRRTGAVRRLHWARIVMPGANGSSDAKAVAFVNDDDVNTPLLRLYDAPCATVLGTDAQHVGAAVAQTSGRDDGISAATSLLLPVELRAGFNAPGVGFGPDTRLSCACGPNLVPSTWRERDRLAYPHPTPSVSETVPSVDSDTAVPPLPRFWKWLTPTATATLKQRVAALEFVDSDAATPFASASGRETGFFETSEDTPIPIADWSDASLGVGGSRTFRAAAALVQLIPRDDAGYTATTTAYGLRSESGMTGEVRVTWRDAEQLNVVVNLLSAGSTGVAVDGLADLSSMRAASWPLALQRNFPLIVVEFDDGSALIEQHSAWAAWAVGACDRINTTDPFASPFVTDDGQRGLPIACLRNASQARSEGSVTVRGTIENVNASNATNYSVWSPVRVGMPSGRQSWPLFGDGAGNLSHSAAWSANFTATAGSLEVLLEAPAAAVERAQLTDVAWRNRRLSLPDDRPMHTSLAMLVVLPPAPPHIGLQSRCGCLTVYVNDQPVDHVTPDGTDCNDFHLVRVADPSGHDFGPLARALRDDGEPLRVRLSQSCQASPRDRPLSISAVAIVPLRAWAGRVTPSLVTTVVPSPGRTLRSAALAAPTAVRCRSDWATLGACSCVGVLDGTRCGPSALTERCFGGECVRCVGQPRVRGSPLNYNRPTPSDGWAPVGWGCAKGFADVVPQSSAAGLCAQHGAELPSLTTEQEWVWLTTLANTTAEPVWTGAFVGRGDALPRARWLSALGNVTDSPTAPLWLPQNPRFDAPPGLLNPVVADKPACLVANTTHLFAAACDGYFSVACVVPHVRPSVLRKLQVASDPAPGTAVAIATGTVASSAAVDGSSTPMNPVNLTLSGPLSAAVSVSLPLGSTVTLPVGFDQEAFSACIAIDRTSLCAPAAASSDDGNIQIGLQALQRQTAGTSVDTGRTVASFTLVRTTCLTVPTAGATHVRLAAVQIDPSRPACDAIDVIAPKAVRAPQAVRAMTCPSDGGWIAIAASDVARGTRDAKRRCVKRIPEPLAYDAMISHCRSRGYVPFVVNTEYEAATVSMLSGSLAAWISVIGPRTTRDSAIWTAEPARDNVPTDQRVRYTAPGLDDNNLDTQPRIGACLAIDFGGPGGAKLGVPTWTRLSCTALSVGFCEGRESQSQSHSTELTETDDAIDETASASDVGTASPLAASPSDTLESSPTVSTSESYSQPSPSASLDGSGSTSLSASASFTQPIVPGRISARNLREWYYDADMWTDEGITFELYLEGGQGFTTDTASNLTTNAGIRITSDLWRQVWGIGVARTLEIAPDDQARDFMRVVVEEGESRSVNITFRNRPQLELRNAEFVVLDFDPEAFNSGRKPLGLPITFRVEPTPVCGPACLMRHAIRYAALPFLVVHLALGGDFLYFVEYATTIVLVESDCNNEAQPLPFIVHPLQVPIGGAPYRFYFGAAVCNVLLLLAIMGLGEAAIWRLRSKFLYTRELAEATLFFPGIYFFPYVLLTPGAVTGTVSLMAFGGWWEKLVGSLGIAFVLLLGLRFGIIFRSSSLMARFIFNPRIDDKYYDMIDDEFERAQSRHLKNKRRKLQRFTRAGVDRDASRAPVAVCSFEGLYGARGIWAPTDRELTFVTRCRYIFADMYNEHYQLGLISVAALWVKAAMLALRPFDFNVCVFEMGSFMGVEALGAATVMYLQPFRRRAHSGISTLVGLCHLGALVLFAMSLFVVRVVDWTLGSYLLGQLLLICGLVPFIVGKLVAMCQGRDSIFPPIPVPVEESRLTDMQNQQRLQAFAVEYNINYLLWKRREEEAIIERIVNPPDYYEEMRVAVEKGKSSMMKEVEAWQASRRMQLRVTEELDFGAATDASFASRPSSSAKDREEQRAARKAKALERRKHHEARMAASRAKRREASQLAEVKSFGSQSDEDDPQRPLSARGRAVSFAATHAVTIADGMSFSSASDSGFSATMSGGNSFAYRSNSSDESAGIDSEDAELDSLVRNRNASQFSKNIDRTASYSPPPAYRRRRGARGVTALSSFRRRDSSAGRPPKNATFSSLEYVESADGFSDTTSVVRAPKALGGGTALLHRGLSLRSADGGVSEDLSTVAGKSVLERFGSMISEKKKHDEEERLARLERRAPPPRHAQAAANDLVHAEDASLPVLPPARQRLAFDDAIALARPDDGAAWTAQLLPSLAAPTDDEVEARRAIWDELATPQQVVHTEFDRPADPRRTVSDKFYVSNRPPKQRAGPTTVAQFALDDGPARQRRFHNPLRELQGESLAFRAASPASKAGLCDRPANEDEAIDRLLHGRDHTHSPPRPEPAHRIVTMGDFAAL